MRRTKKPSRPQKSSSVTSKSSSTGQITFSHHQQEVYSSPLPPSEELEKLKKILPDGPERLLQIVESEQKHRHNCEQKLVEIEKINHLSANKERKRGQWMAFFIAISSIGATLWLILENKDAQAFVFGITALASLIGAFTYSHKQKQDD